MKTQQDSGVKSSGFLKMFLFITEIEPFLPFLFVLREINRTKQFPQKVFVNSFKVIPLCSIWKGQCRVLEWEILERLSVLELVKDMVVSLQPAFKFHFLIQIINYSHVKDI